MSGYVLSPGRRGAPREPGTGTTPVFRLVPEDEADAAHGLISWTAPLAQSLLGREAGESVPFQGVEAEIVSIEP